MLSIIYRHNMFFIALGFILAKLIARRAGNRLPAKLIRPIGMTITACCQMWARRRRHGDLHLCDVAPGAWAAIRNSMNAEIQHPRFGVHWQRPRGSATAVDCLRLVEAGMARLLKDVIDCITLFRPRYDRTLIPVDLQLG